MQIYVKLYVLDVDKIFVHIDQHFLVTIVLLIFFLEALFSIKGMQPLLDK